jgi:hypothetical protein
MKRVIIITLACILAFSQYGWGCQPVAQEAAGGLVDFVLDIVTAPCSLLAVCLGVDGPTCSYPQKQRLTCVPPCTPRRPPCATTPVRKVPRAGGPPGIIVPTPRGPREGPPLKPAQVQIAPPPLRTQQQAPPQRELIPPPPPGRPGVSVPALPPAGPVQPTPLEEQRTVTPKKEAVPGRPAPTAPGPPQGVIPAVPKETPPGVPPRLEPPATPKTETTRKEPKPPRKHSYPAPCMPVYPPCGPQFFFR